MRKVPWLLNEWLNGTIVEFRTTWVKGLCVFYTLLMHIFKKLYVANCSQKRMFDT